MRNDSLSHNFNGSWHLTTCIYMNVLHKQHRSCSTHIGWCLNLSNSSTSSFMRRYVKLFYTLSNPVAISL
jgi:hypothetical protein